MRHAELFAWKMVGYKRTKWMSGIPKLEPRTVGKLGVKCFLCMVSQKEPLLSTAHK